MYYKLLSGTQEPEAVFNVHDVYEYVMDHWIIGKELSVDLQIPMFPPFSRTLLVYNNHKKRSEILIEREKYDIEDHAIDHTVTVYYMLQHPDNPKMLYIVRWVIPVDNSGVRTPDFSLKAHYFSIDVNDWVELDVSSLDDDRDVETIVSFDVYLMFMTFLNCKNIVPVEHITPKGIIRKKKKRNQPYFEKTYTLDVLLPKSKKGSGGQGTGDGSKKSFHLCAGHFRTYDENSGGLFGKYKGKFWVPSHARGDKAIGKVNKDYNVKLRT